MDKANTIKLLNDTFNSDFDINRFAKFVKELFNEFSINQKSWSVWREYQDYIESYVSLGNYTDKAKKVIAVLVVKLKKSSSRDRARIMQRNFIAKYLSNAEKDAALVAFCGEDSDWRFSFVKMEYNLVKDETGKTVISKELTPAKRYSFLVGVNEPNHTCRRQFLELVMQDEINPSIDEIESAFSIDNVTKEFFDEYKELFLELEESLQKVKNRDKQVKEEFESKGISTVDFAKKLLGQIVFIYFLQKKGWLGVKKGEKWGDGPKDFMRCLFGGGIKNYKPLVPYKNFFNEILEPLFYEALANDRSADDHFYRLFNCKIPFLNGGLFEPINEYKWAETDIVIDNSIFDRILTTFDRFNFTVKEDEPLEKEVAVDPEMLGKVFEKLLEVKDRKSKGAFYTPREIVHYMCQQSLINYLETNINIPRKDIETFIQLGDLTLASSIRVLQEIEKKEEKLKRGIISARIFEDEVKEELDKLGLPKSIVINYKEIDKLLKEIKIVDPAVGSGAFPVGMMNEIIKARSILSIYFHEKRSDYDLKREIIENCLYGVDIESSAVDITKLRFWLSLIVDELDMQNIKPLPNLDHKIMCGNSLLEEFEGVKLFDEKLLGEVKRNYVQEMSNINKKISELIRNKADEKDIKKLQKEYKDLEKESKKDKNSKQSTLGADNRIKESQRKLSELKSLQKDFFNAENRNLKKQLREKIDKIEWELIEETLKEQGNLEAMQKLEQYKKNKAKPFFLWKLYFAEVFQRDNPGFDVVIGNPPYFQLQKHKDVAEQLISQGFYTFSKSGDIYCIFYEKGISILRSEGTLTYISSNSWLKTKYGLLLRKYLKTHTNPSKLVDFENSQVFNTAIVESCVIVIEKSVFKNQLSAVNFNLASEKNKNIADYFDKHHTILLDLDDNGWIISNSKYAQLRKKILENSTVLKNLNLHIYIGILNGFNEAFIIDTEIRNSLIKKDPKSKDIIKPLLRGRDVGKYFYNWQGLWLINSHNGVKNKLKRIDVQKDYPAIYEHLVKYKSKLEVRLNKGSHWSNLRNCAYFEEFEKPKIIWGELSDKPKFAFDDAKYYAEATLFAMLGDNLKYLLSILNSKLGLWFFEQIATSSGMGTSRWKKYKIEQFPIKNTTKQNKEKTEQLVDQILSITKDDDYLDNPDKQAKVKKLEKETDELVYALYGITEEEKKIIEGN